MFQAIIFDFDGVILDSEPLHFKAYTDVFGKLGLRLSYDEYVEKYLGIADKEMVPKLFSEKGFHFSLEQTNALIHEKIERYQEIITQSDALPMIEALDKYIQHVSQTISKIAICSGSTRSEILTVLAKLQEGKLQPYFNTIIAADDVARGKPSPEGYLLTAQRLQVSPENCMVIEDTPHGVEAAKAAGMYAVALLTSYTEGRFQYADKIVQDFNQLISE